MIGHLVQRSARRWPDRAAIVDERGTLTFGELAERVSRLANALIALGLEPGDRVLDVQLNARTCIETDLACAIAGLVRVPVDPSLSETEIAYIGSDSGAAAAVIGAELDALGDRLRSDVGSIGDVIGVDPAGRMAGVHDYEELLHAASPKSPAFTGSPSGLISINYSSGTTGAPKGCMCSARARIASANAVLTSITGVLDADDVFLHAEPMARASSIFVLPYLVSGATQVLIRRYAVESVLERVRDHAVTGTALTTTALVQLADQVAASGSRSDDLRSLRYIAYTGAPTAPDRITRCAEALAHRLVQFYGLAEALAPLSVLTAEDHHEPRRLASAGLPVPGVAARVIADDGREAGAGEAGQLLVGGDHIMRGYWSHRETATPSLRKGWVRTGDIATVDDRGYIHLLDRHEDIIISGGLNVIPREVEDVLGKHPAVGRSSVVGLLDREWGEVLIAFVVATTDTIGLEQDLRRLCEERLPDYKAPRRYEFVEELPMSAAGKLSRKVLRARASEDAARSTAGSASRGPEPQ